MDNFREEIVRVCEIAYWDNDNHDIQATDQEVEEIRQKIEILKKKGDVTLNDVKNIVGSMFPNALYVLMDGIDTKDVNTLLTLAIQKTKKK